MAQGIPATDPFSYTMSHYPFVDHEWLTNIIFHTLHSTVGYSVMGFLFAFFAIGAFALQFFVLSDTAKRFSPVFFWLAFLSVSGMVGIRPQLLTWVFFSVFLLILRDWDRFKRFWWLLPLLMLVWVNFHGGFAIGIVALVVATSYWFCKKREAWKLLFLVFTATVAATFAMPYGWRGWWEVWMQMTDGTLRWTIMEWVPMLFVPNISLWLFVVFSVLFIGRYWRRFRLLDLLLYVGLLIAAFSSIRHAALWLLVAFPLTVESLTYFYADVKKIHLGEVRFFQMGKILFVGLCLLTLPEIQSAGYASGLLGKQSSYPQIGIEYLQKHPIEGNVFSTYDWGGYLIWKYPEKKVFIDGRMPSWRWEGNIRGESNYAMKEYQAFVEGKTPFQAIVTKYHITTLFLPAPYDFNRDPIQRTILSFGNEVLHLPLRKEEGFMSFVKRAKQEGWTLVYQDETVHIYQKP